MDTSPDLLGESDYFHIAVLDQSNLTPVETKFQNGRVWFYYYKKDAEPILTEYDSGRMKASLRDFAASLQRVKTRIFSIERERRGGRNATFYS